MGRYLTAALLFAIVPAAAMAQSAAPSPPARDLKTIVANGELRVAMTRFDLPPFHWVARDGSVQGMDADFVRKLAAALNVKPVILADSPTFDGTVSAIVEGRADIALSKLSQTYDRLARVRFSDPLIAWRQALLFNRTAVATDAGGRPPQEVLRRFNRRLGVIGASAYVDFARQNFPAAQLIEAKSWDDAVAALREGRVDAIYRDEFEIKRLLKLNPAMNVHFGAALITDQIAFISVAICDTCGKLQEFINFFITQNKGPYTVDNILTASLREPPK